MGVTEALDRAMKLVDRGNQALREVLVWLLLPVGARIVLETTVTRASLPLTVKILTLVVLFAIMGLALWMVSTSDRRAKLVGKLHHWGFFWPAAYSASVLYLSIACFTALAYLLHEHGVVTIQSTESATAVQFAQLQDFFLWHFLDAIPIFQIPDTILLKNPYVYTEPLLGWILLAFKVLVILPVIAAFTVCFKSTGAAE